MINIKLNPLWSKTVLAITFGFLLLLSSYILIDPVGSAENILNIYKIIWTQHYNTWLEKKDFTPLYG